MLRLSPSARKSLQAIAADPFHSQTLFQQVDHRLIQGCSAPELFLLQRRSQLVGQVTNRQMGCIHITH